MTRLIDLPALSQLVQAIGPAALIGQLAEAIKADFLLWPEFDKSPRSACQRTWGD